MKDKRKSKRSVIDIDIEFKVTEVQFRQSTRIMSKGRLVDLSEHGFGLETRYPVEKGQVITIKPTGHSNIPKFGLAQWTKNEKDLYHAGFGFKFNSDIE